MRRFKKPIIILFFINVLFFCGGYLLLALYYRGEFCPNTWINGVYCTGKTVEEVDSELLSQIEAPVITITDREGNAYTIDLGKLDYSADYRVPLNQFMEKQNPYLWIDNLALPQKYDLEPEISYSQEKLENAWNNLPFVQQEKNNADVLEIRRTEDGYILYNGLQNKLDLEKAFMLLMQRLSEGENSLQLKDENCYYDVQLSKEQEQIKALWDKIDIFQQCKLVYDMGTEKIPLDAKTVSSFLETENGIPILDEEGKLVIDEKQVQAFVDFLCDEYDTYGRERSFESTRGDIILVKGGTYGTKLNGKKELAYLLEALSQQESYTGEEKLHIPEYEKEGVVRGKNDIGDTYIEVDMTEQKMYYYQEGELVLETEIVTGNTGRKMGTPEGVNYVYNKQRNRTLRGPGYASFVKYWMPVKGSIGIHDASWRKEFGGEIYKKSGSHGCINTPGDKMAELYDMVEVGTPVIMFY